MTRNEKSETMVVKNPGDNPEHIEAGISGERKCEGKSNSLTMEECGIPVIDISNVDASLLDTAFLIDKACREIGFFVLRGSSLKLDLVEDLEKAAREFFSLPESEKMEINMEKAGSAWRGYFPMGGELTSGRKDGKEGLYFGNDHPKDHPKVLARTPLFGTSLYPKFPKEMEDLVKEYVDSLRKISDDLMRLLDVSLGSPLGWFEENLTKDPITLFRIFNYRPDSGYDFGVGEHTDYGLITLLLQDSCGGLQVKRKDGEWIDVPPRASGSTDLIVNIGDMLEKITGGLWVSTPHRVKAQAADPGCSRLSFPFFYDLDWSCQPSIWSMLRKKDRTFADDEGDTLLDRHSYGGGISVASSSRWDKADVHDWSGTYGEYLSGKVAKVFPLLFAKYGNTCKKRRTNMVD